MKDELFKLSQHFLKHGNQKYKRYFFYTRPFDNRFSILLGQRGVGKTTVIIQYLMELVKNDIFNESILYVPVDHFLIKNYSLYQIAEEFYNHNGKVICFDEIHKYSAWSQELKSIYDSFPKLKIIASGSSILEIKKGTHDLSRRALVYKLYGMSFREYLEITLDLKFKSYDLDYLVLNHQKIAASITEQLERIDKKVKPLFTNYLKTGYYPFFFDYEDKQKYYLALEQNIHTTLEKDLISIYPSLSGNSTRKILKLLSILSQNVPYSPDMAKLKRMTEIFDERTLKSYLKYLDDAGIILLLYNKAKGMHKLEKPDKIYLNNTNLMYSICDDSLVNVGSLRETFFANSVYPYHQLNYTYPADFEVNKKYIFEIGGKGKNKKQIYSKEEAYLVIDDSEIGIDNKIPLYLFGFLY